LIIARLVVGEPIMSEALQCIQVGGREEGRGGYEKEQRGSYNLKNKSDVVNAILEGAKVCCGP
jgi:hypothetical protein